MSIYEIVLGVVIILVAAVIIIFTLAQDQKGQGLSAAIMGDNSFMAAGRERGINAKMAKVTKICGVIFFIAVLVMSILSTRLAG